MGREGGQKSVNPYFRNSYVTTTTTCVTTFPSDVQDKHEKPARQAEFWSEENSAENDHSEFISINLDEGISEQLLAAQSDPKIKGKWAFYGITDFWVACGAREGGRNAHL